MTSPVQPVVMRPGPGWKRLSGAVYERNDGLRMHMLGLVRLPSGKLIDQFAPTQYQQVDKLVMINGGNRKRGLMAWAASLAA